MQSEPSPPASEADCVGSLPSLQEGTAFPVPAFLRERRIHFSIDTSGYCQARCVLCVWPELQNRRRMMSVDEFAAVLRHLKGFSFSEFGLNSINEPFSDATILEKLEMLIDSGLEMDALFFSSNWLAPDQKKVLRFAELVRRASVSTAIQSINLNATISGINDDTYDVLQAGRELTGKNLVKYRKLSFERARENVTLLALALDERIPPKARVILRIKAYGYLFTQEQFAAYWKEHFAKNGLRETGMRRLRFTVNHGLTSFARAPEIGTSFGKCKGGWLDRGLVVGPDGRLGLCCHEGSHKIQLDNLVDLPLDQIVAAPAFREQQRIVSGSAVPPKNHPCSNCEYFEPTQAKV
jgi:hypothetical protein